MADALDFDAAVLADMKMAVTEACTNVVVHAYDEDAGMLEVEMLADENGLTIVVRDHGAGIQPRPARSEPPALGLGLPLIAALSDAFELKGSRRPGHRGAHDLRLRARRRPRRRRTPCTGNVGADGRWDPDAELAADRALGADARLRRLAQRGRARACGPGARAPWTRSGARARA